MEQYKLNIIYQFGANADSVTTLPYLVDAENRDSFFAQFNYDAVVSIETLNGYTLALHSNRIIFAEAILDVAE